MADDILHMGGIHKDADGSLRRGPKYPEVVVQLSGEDGNAFAIMGRVSTALRRAGVPQSERDAYYAESTAGDYDNLLGVAQLWVTVH
jgi:hypothetical protein